MNVSTWCIKNPIAAIMFFVMLCFAGVLGYQNMKVQNFPDLDVPNIIITASLPVFSLFSQEPLTRILLLGGSYRPDYECTAGHITVAALREVHADIAFLGCTGISADGTIRDNTADQVPVKRAIMEAADTSVMLCDSSKFPGQGTYTVASASTLSHVVTDAPVPAPLLKRLAVSGTEVLYS